MLEMESMGGPGEHGDQEGTGPRMLADVTPPYVPEGASAMTVLVEWPPGHSGTPPHRHSGPCFGYVTEGAVRWELEGEPERVIKAGETFWEPGGEVIHYQNGNALSDTPAKYVVFMLCAPGRPMLTLVGDKELDERAHLRAPRPSAD